jgi:hypothetical protein
MYSKFIANFKPDSPLLSVPEINDMGNSALNELIFRFGGISFNNGLYHILNTACIAQWSRTVLEYFPGLPADMTCFAYDWLGRFFAIDPSRLNCIYVFEPGTGETLQIPNDLVSFHETELLVHPDAALVANLHAAWIAKGGTAPRNGECIGYKHPLFLGGKDVIENLKLSDLNVYWAIIGQLLAKTRRLSVGTQIGTIRLED